MPSKVAVLRSDRLGDIVLTSGYLSWLRECLPGTQIDVWLDQGMGVCAQILHPGLNIRTLPFSRWLECSDDVLREWIAQMEEEHYDELIVPQFTLSFPEIIALAYLSVEKRWGFRNHEVGVSPQWVYRRLGESRNAEGAWFTGGPEVDPFCSEVAKYSALADSQGLPQGSVQPRLHGVDLKGIRSGVLIWPGSGIEKRRWPASRFAELSAALSYAEVTIGGARAEQAIVEELQDELRRKGSGVTVAYRPEAALAETAAWLSGFETVLTNDTGIGHLAAAAGTRVIAISGSQHQGRFVVQGGTSLTVFLDVPCRQCRELCLFEETPYPCVGDIETQAVAALVNAHQSGPQLLPASQFTKPERLFSRLKAARQSEERSKQAESLDFHKGAGELRSTLHATESQREEWQQLFLSAEKQRDQFQQEFQNAAHQRDNWKQLFGEAEQQRDELRQLFQNAAEHLDTWKAIYQDIEKQRDDLAVLVDRFYEHFPWAKSPEVSGAALPKISIVTPSFQQGEFIEETIRSVLEQQYLNFEHIVVDAGSTDQTLEILNRYPHLRWISEPDKGQAHAINKGLLLSAGEIVAYLNSDDVYRPGAFQAVVQFFEQHPEAQIVAGDCAIISEKSETVGHLKAKFERIEDLIRYWGWDKWYCIPQPAVFMRRSLLTRVGLFDVSLHMVMDYDFWLRAARVTQIHTAPQTLAAFRLAGNTKTSSQTYRMYIEELEVSRKHWGLLPPGQRARVALTAHHHLGSKLLNVAEHYVLSGEEPQLVSSLLSGSVQHWPVSLLYPRLLLSAAGSMAGQGRMKQAVSRLHRDYLGLKWRLQNLRARRNQQAA